MTQLLFGVYFEQHFKVQVECLGLFGHVVLDHVELQFNGFDERLLFVRGQTLLGRCIPDTTREFINHRKLLLTIDQISVLFEIPIWVVFDTELILDKCTHSICVFLIYILIYQFVFTLQMAIEEIYGSIDE